MGDASVMCGEGAKGDSGGKVEIKHDSKKLQGRGEAHAQLLPGIPNEITLDHVAPKLPWTAFYMLSSVSSGWQQAIQSHQVHDARVRTQSTQTLVAMNQTHDRNVTALALFSVSDGSTYHLPPIPGLSQGFPWACQCTSLDGKLYILGGYVGPTNILKRIVPQASREVYVCDLVGQKQWKQCASMAESRARFGCGVMNGKIYVFGGTSANIIPDSCGSEMYDPSADVWSPIAPMMGSPGSYQQVVPIGEEFFVLTERLSYLVWSSHYKGFPLEVYNPLKNQWRSMGMDESMKFFDILLAVGGKLHKLSGDSIDIYDTCANAWNPLQSCSFGVLEPTVSFRVPLHAALAVDDELLCVVHYKTYDHRKWYLMRSQGLGRQNKEIEWQKLECSLSFDECHCDFVCPIQL